MVIESRKIFGAAAALALVGAVLWASALLFAPPEPAERVGSVEVVQVPERSWTVEIKELGATETQSGDRRTAANR